MGWTFSTAEPSDDYISVSPSESSALLTVLDCMGVLDVDAIPPAAPPAVDARLGEDAANGDPYPLGCQLTDAERAYFAFRSTDSRRVPLAKLSDNEAWLLEPEECALLSDAAHATRTAPLPPRVLEFVSPRDLVQADADARVRDLLLMFAEFCSVCEKAGGMWAS